VAQKLKASRFIRNFPEVTKTVSKYRVTEYNNLGKNVRYSTSLEIRL